MWPRYKSHPQLFKEWTSFSILDPWPYCIGGNTEVLLEHLHMDHMVSRKAERTPTLTLVCQATCMKA